MRYWIILVLALVFFAVCFRSAQGDTLPGTAILLTVEVTWDGGQSRAEQYVVVRNPLFIDRTFCAPGAVKRYKAGGNPLTWCDPFADPDPEPDSCESCELSVFSETSPMKGFHEHFVENTESSQLLATIERENGPAEVETRDFRDPKKEPAGVPRPYGLRAV